MHINCFNRIYTIKIIKITKCAYADRSLHAHKKENGTNKPFSFGFLIHLAFETREWTALTPQYRIQACK